MRCPDCNKFVGLEFQDPEIDSIDIEGEEVVAQVRLVRNCAECSQELKTGDLDIRCDVPEAALKHVADKGEGHDLEVCDESACPIEEGGGRYKKSYFGAEVTGTVKCCHGDCADLSWEFSMSDQMAASEMQEEC